MKKIFFIILLLPCSIAFGQKGDYRKAISTHADKIEKKVIQWREDIHQNPELGEQGSTHCSTHCQTPAIPGHGG